MSKLRSSLRRPFLLFVMRRIFTVLSLVLSTMAFGQSTEKLDEFIDQWHAAASKADFENYFGAMEKSFVFLGTAPGERWTKNEFAGFSKPYFDKGTAWDFKASNRVWMFNSDKTLAWFDEDLETWMEGCRGSGILSYETGEWKLVYYNLTVLIENEKIKEFIDLRRAEIKTDEK